MQVLKSKPRQKDKRALVGTHQAEGGCELPGGLLSSRHGIWCWGGWCLTSWGLSGLKAEAQGWGSPCSLPIGSSGILSQGKSSIVHFTILNYTRIKNIYPTQNCNRKTRLRTIAALAEEQVGDSWPCPLRHLLRPRLQPSSTAVQKCRCVPDAGMKYTGQTQCTGTTQTGSQTRVL